MFVVELYNSQVMLRGCESNGYVIASAGKASLLACDHRPVWVHQQLQSKSTLVGSIDSMQAGPHIPSPLLTQLLIGTIYVGYRPFSTWFGVTAAKLHLTVTGCLTAVADWMSANRLKLNSDKTEFMWLTSPRSQHRLPTSGPLIGSNVVSPSATVRDLGVFIDQDLTMKTHVQQIASRCFAILRQLRSIRRCIPTSVFNSLVSALVPSRLDYCNSLLIDLPLTHIPVSYTHLTLPTKRIV